MYMAKWGPKGFLVSPEKIVTFDGFSTSVELKSDSANDTSGKAPTNTKGREPQTVSMSINYVRAAGVDPRGQFEEWTSLVGQYNPLYIGEVRFGPEYLMLTKVDLSDLQLAPDGTFISAKIAVSFDEYTPPKPKKTIAIPTVEKAITDVVQGVFTAGGAVIGSVFGKKEIVGKSANSILETPKNSILETPKKIVDALLPKPKAPEEITEEPPQPTTQVYKVKGLFWGGE